MKPKESGSQRIVVGQLAGVFGVKGWLKVKSFTQPEDNILAYHPWYLRTAHGLKEVEVDDSKLRPQGLVVHFKGYDDRDASAQIGGRVKIEVDADQLPALQDGDYYWHQLEGLAVITEWQGEQCLGRVKHLLETGANDVLVIEPTEQSIDDRERMLPFVVDQYVTQVDLEQGVIRVVWDPEF